MKKLVLLIFALLSLNCSKKTNNNQNVFFEIETIKINSLDSLTIKLVNETNKNYFIILDTSRMYDYLTLNNTVNNTIHLKPKIFSDKDTVSLKIEFYINKLINNNKINPDCILKERYHTQKIMNSIKKLNNIIIVKKNSFFKFKIPFNTNFYNCNRKYSYSIKFGKKYYFQIEYKMDEKLINKIVDKSQLLKLIEKGYFPYYEKIVSNKTPLLHESISVVR